MQIVAEFEERQSAKVPGRPVFNDMLARLGRGEAQGILCWKIDRLARNPVDAAQIQWLLQRGTVAHIQTYDRSYYPQDNVLLMSVEFGMANQYVRDLSSNTSRGLRQKAKRGEFPGTAPVGYRNNPRTKLIVVDKKKAPVVRAAFELYAKGESRLEDISNFLFDNGIRSWYGNRMHKDRITFILSNIFYYGHFRYKGEVHEGKHAPIVEKSLFDKVQKVLVRRGHPQAETTDPQPLCGLLSCGECGMSITAEVRVKYQKNGNVHQYVYYRCTKKSAARCAQPYVRQESLSADLSKLLSLYVLPPEWAQDFERRMQEDEKEAEHTAQAALHSLREEARDISRKLDRLTDLYIAQDIERGDYLARRAALMAQGKSVEGQMTRLKRDAGAWLEPMRHWISEAQQLAQIARSTDLPSKKSSLQNIFGSNLVLQNKKVSGTAKTPYAELRSARANFSKTDPVLLLAPRVGLEPTTNSLTGSCSTIELPRNVCRTHELYVFLGYFLVCSSPRTFIKHVS